MIAFIFADLIAMPLILIYAKFYGWRLTLRLVGLFYVVMVLAGLSTELLFSAAGLVPAHRSITVESAYFSWNYTTWLNLAFLVVAAAVWWLARHRSRFGGGQGYAIDPVCGMQVRTADAPASARFESTTYSFCSDRCRDRFVADPSRFAHAGPDATSHQEAPADSTAVDPICGMAVSADSATSTRRHEGVEYRFCSTGCAERFDEDPAALLAGPPPSSTQH